MAAQNLFRFFVFKKEGDFFIFSQETWEHIKIVRIKEGDPLICVYEKQFYECVLNGKKAKCMRILDENHEFPKPVGIALGILKPKAMKLALQKATELGVTNVFPFVSQNTNHSVLQARKMLATWQKILQMASEQSFRNIIPTLHGVQEFKDLVKNDAFAAKFIAHETASVITKPNAFQLDNLYFIGPEGGFTIDEVNFAIVSNCTLLNLGPRILRSETAVISIMANINTNFYG